MVPDLLVLAELTNENKKLKNKVKRLIIIKTKTCKLLMRTLRILNLITLILIKIPFKQ